MRVSQLDLISPQAIFRTYAAGVGALGVFAYMWGPIWINGDLNGQPFGMNALVRIAGATALVAAGSAAGLGLVRDSIDGRRALWWFTWTHWLATGLILVQSRIVFGSDSDLPFWYRLLLSVLILVSSLLLASTGLVQDQRRRTAVAGLMLEPQPGMSQELRSQYEEEIRKAAAQEERSRLARDLHDSIKQQVFAIQTSAATAEARLTTDPPGAAQAILQVRESARSAMTELEAVSEGLRAAPLEIAGLSGALQRECEAFELRTGTRLTVSVDRVPARTLLPPGGAEALFRIAQEALANVARHARARHVSVTLRVTPTLVELTVQDDGDGFDRTRATAGQGLANMRERVRAHGGLLEITTDPGLGTTIAASLPIDAVDPGRFRTRAIAYSLAAFGTVAVALAHWVPVTFDAWQLPLALFSLNALRHFVAWQRARRLVSATP